MEEENEFLSLPADPEEAFAILQQENIDNWKPSGKAKKAVAAGMQSANTQMS